MNILLVEDDPLTIDMVVAYFQKFGHRVSTIINGQEAMACLAERPQADVVILDWLLPDVDGLTICRAIRARYSLAELPVLMLSALGDGAERRIEGLEAGANDFMPKPFSLQELLMRVQGLGTLRATQRANTALDHPLTTAGWQPSVLMLIEFRGLSPEADADHSHGDRVQTLDSLVTAQGGTMLEFTTDHVLVSFGAAPGAEGRALASAQRVQQTLKETAERSLVIGIHRGNVWLGETTLHNTRHYMVSGAEVRLVYLMVKSVDQGGIIMSDVVYHALKAEVSINHVHRLLGVGGAAGTSTLRIYELARA
ncbi:MAG: response regulator [Anaerolineales bacterium]